MTMHNQAQLFKVSLSDWNGSVHGRPFRKIAIDDGASLYDLAVVTIHGLQDRWRSIIQCG